ncbi:2,3-dihydroxybenzoyl adenylate synthase [Streptomyces sp. MUSC 14]|uniref:(2,3-dihydroxybenzoyl)adenylate synthase n=1 Tax=Streptomyces sp. MUSC 14 TaxID=1354889 RepID=UPI0008F58D47|nr:AMP-binding protein [Streptomyces sp. MUSC 14]OIJ99214.1 2,3-dihydroxybenzoyl adenylate synthase [Streptomyces sp. MUSC 14]
MLDGCTPLLPEINGRYYDHGYYQGAALHRLLAEHARTYATRTALVHGDRRLTYRELNRRVDRVAAGLTLRGIRPGDRAIVQLPNVPEFVITVYALMRAGAVPVFAPTSHRADEIGSLARLTEAAVYIGPSIHHGFDHAAMAAQISVDHPRLRRAFTLDDPEGTRGIHGGFTTAPSGCLFFPLSSVDAPRDPDRTHNPNDVAFFLLSGGSTAAPRLVPRTHNDYAYQTRAAAELIGLGPEDVYLAALPATSNLTFGCPGIVGTLATGGTVVLIDAPDPAAAFRAIETEKVTVTSLVPAVADLWLDTLPDGPYDLSSLRLIQTGGARPHPELAARIPQTFDCRIQQVFEMPEGLLTLTRLADTDDVIQHTQGRPLSPGDEIRITDSHGRDVPPGTPGQLWTRGPCTLRGYYKAPDQNTRSFTPDGFCRTGHLARLTEDANLVVVGHTATESGVASPGNLVNAACTGPD